jgi:hypothetical protein
MEIIEIYWSDLHEDAQQRLIEAGLTDENVIDSVFPVATLLVGGGTI